MKALLLALLVLPTTCVLGCIIGWVTTIDGREQALTCGYMFDHGEVVLVFKDRMRLAFSRKPSSRWLDSLEDESGGRRISITSDVEDTPVEVSNGDVPPLAPLAPALVKVDGKLDAGAVDAALEQLRTIKPARKQRAAYHALRVRAFELQGDFAAAQVELARLLRVDPACHNSSEPIHAFILAAKEKLRAGTLDLARDSVLPFTGYTPMTKEVAPPAVEWRSIRRQLPSGRALFDAILTQIHLQENFFAGDRRIIADLYYELGHTAAVDYWLERAVEYYELALEYGSPKTERIEEILAHYRQLIADRPHTHEDAYRNMYHSAALDVDSAQEIVLRYLEETGEAPVGREGEPSPAP